MCQKKRYSEIDFLHKTLSKLYPNIPPMPGKTIFKIKNRDALESRKKQLELFLKEVTEKIYPKESRNMANGMVKLLKI